MQRRIILLMTVLLIAATDMRAQNGVVLERYREYLLQTIDPEGDMGRLAATLNAKHQWDDINYQDTERANWQPLIHLKRVRDLALVWANPRSPYYHQQKIWMATEAALDHWLGKRYRNSNWWHNEIGVPQYMRDIIVLLKEKLSPDELRGSLKVLAQYRVHENAVGANLTWSADLGFHYAALTGDRNKMKKCRDLIIREIHITTKDGVQPDFSFHQHGSRLQMYQYGRAFLWDNVRLAWQFRGTQWAFPQDRINILTDFVLKGWQWMARGIHSVPGTMDRSVSRKDALDNADIRRLIPYLSELSPSKARAFAAIARQQEGKTALKGYRYYPYSDFAAYQAKNFSFFLKTISSRTLPAESINNENLKGHLLNSGDAYLIRSGKEYFNLMPVWNWEALPGVTSFKGAYKIKRMPFVGSVSNGMAGLTVMDYYIEDKTETQAISAHKFWASHGNAVVCLIAGLDARNTSGEIFTALDQCRWTGDVTVNKPGNILREGNYRVNDVRWIYHAGLAYIPLQPSKMILQLKTDTGSWKAINASLSDKPVAEKIFTPLLLHDAGVKNETGGYVLASCRSARMADKLANKHDWKILKNNREYQAVSFKDGTVMIAFFQPGSISLTEQKKLTVVKPCLILISGNKLYASDPSQGGGTIRITLDNKSISVQLPSHGFTSEGMEVSHE